ncbi:hypothetical protein JKF63_07786 [Porcisia hertigi]|uniref:BSD domain-containing protein n=1 Tax=Porcisia hertigi TaxID=2761500 RepID=A0A837AYD6_9TRYP|nr:hypothetical protein JKF63_07786 [Porcisia hertigi]
MSSVEFVRNVDDHTAIYRWEAVGLEDLSRQNKLSSLPFWIPNATSRKHQFKLVLLRGLVQSAVPSSDPFGVLVEFIPPPPSPSASSGGFTTSEAVSSSSSPSGDFPGGCAVTCEVLPVDFTAPSAVKEEHGWRGGESGGEATGKGIKSTKMTVLNANSTQVSFPDFIPAEVLHNARYVSGIPLSFTLQITIEIGISVPLHQATTTALSFFSSLTTSVSHLLGSTSRLYHEGRESINNVILASSASAVASTSDLWHNTAFPLASAYVPASTAPAKAAVSTPVPLPPWEQPPEEWRDRTSEWRTLVSERLAGLNGTYRHGREKVPSPDEVALLAEVGLLEADLWARYSLFDFDRDVHEGLLASSEIRARRYSLVPARLKEETFWANYFWKVHCVGQCVTERQVAAVLAVLCTPPRVGPTDLSTPVEEVMGHIYDSEDVIAIVEGFIKCGEAAEPWCTVAMETARHCKVLLEIASQSTSLAANRRRPVESALTNLEETLSWHRDTLRGITNSCAVSVDDIAGPAAAPGATEEGEVAITVSAFASPTPPHEVRTISKELQREASSDASLNAAAPTAAEPTISSLFPGTGDGLSGVGEVQFAVMPWEEEDEEKDETTCVS